MRAEFGLRFVGLSALGIAVSTLKVPRSQQERWFIDRNKVIGRPQTTFGQKPLAGLACDMSTLSSQQLRTALNDDLRKAGSEGFSKVVNDAARKTFTANKDGAVFEFAHSQPDTAYWKGVKYYGSGSRSVIRIPRAPSESPEVSSRAKVRA